MSSLRMLYVEYNIRLKIKLIKKALTGAKTLLKGTNNQNNSKE